MWVAESKQSDMKLEGTKKDHNVGFVYILDNRNTSVN